MHLTAEFRQAGAVKPAIAGLQVSGTAVEAMEVFSSEPVELGIAVMERRSRMSLVAVAGAAGACLLGGVFVYYAQHSYPVITGGMPVFSPWATGVIFYELTMLGAIGATFLALLWESGLARRGVRRGGPVMDPGRIYLRVECPAEQASAIGEKLYRAGADRVTKS